MPSKDKVERPLPGKHESKAAYDIVSRTGVGLQKILAVRNNTHTHTRLMNRSEKTQSAAFTYGRGAQTLFLASASAFT